MSLLFLVAVIGVVFTFVLLRFAVLIAGRTVDQAFRRGEPQKLDRRAAAR